MRDRTGWLCLCLFGWFYAHGASAVEQGQTTYPNGVNTVLTGLLPKPGETRFYNYTEYYSANAFVGSDGKAIVPGFQLDVIAEAPRIVHSWQQTLGPFTVSSGLIAPFLRVSVSVPGASQTRYGLGDLILQPLFFGYSSPRHDFFAFVTADVGVPTGRYRRDRVANTSANDVAIWPNVDVTWFPAPGWEFSGSLLFEFHTKNPATDYQSGIVAETDYYLGHAIGSAWHFGVQGYALKQLTDDRVQGVRVLDGFRAQAIGLGPQLRYSPWRGAALVAKYQKEFAVENRPRGQRFWLQFSAPLP